MEDFFKLADKEGLRKINGSDFNQFLKRTGLDISDHKLKEILTI